MFSKIKETGFRYSFAILLNRVIPRRLFRCRRFFIFQLVDRASQNTTSAPFTYAWSTGQRERQSAMRLTGVDQPPINARLATVFENQTLVAAVWLSPSGFDECELGLRFELNNDDFWLFSAYVLPAYRRQGIYHALLNFVADSTHTENPKRQIWFAINPDNIRSMKAHGTFGVTRQARIFSLRLLSMAYGRCNPLGESTVHSERRITMHCQHSPILVRLS